MTPRYTWTPASEPPEGIGRVVRALTSDATEHWPVAHFPPDNWQTMDGTPLPNVTHWRDVEPPTAPAAPPLPPAS